MSQIRVSSDEIIQYANQLRSLKNEVLQVFNDVKNRMNQLETSWSSPASHQLQSQFERCYPSFQGYVDAIEAYASYLEISGRTYQENEEMLQTSFQQ